MPIILYNVPGRTVASLEVETIIELSHVPGVIGIKDATGNMEIAAAIAQQAKTGFIKLSGDDGTYADYLVQNGMGIISVGSHVIPEIFMQITDLSKQGRFAEAKALQASYKELIDSLYTEANPIPVKKALELMGLIAQGNLRLPLFEANIATVEKLKRTLEQKGVIK
jgi:4-hydroxy-tetrahydrodipicolinate synthase